jgi:hypothetical protein
MGLMRPIMPNIEAPVAVIEADRDQMRRGLLSTGGWSVAISTEHVASLPDTDGALQMLARHRIEHAQGWQPIATAPRDGTWFFTRSDPNSYCPYDVAQFDLATGEFVKAGCGFQYVTHWLLAEDIAQDDVDSPAARIDYARTCFAAILEKPENATALARAGLDLCNLTAAHRAEMRGDA